MPSLTEPSVPALTATHIEDLQLASSKLTGAKRRAFQAEMTLKYCAGRARQQERDSITQLQIKLDNSPESHGHRTQFLARQVAFADTIGCPIQLLYYNPTS